MAVLGYPLYTAFFSASQLGGELLTWCAPNSIFFALYSISAAVLQGINKQKHAVLGTLYGVIVKALINIPLIKLMQANGSILATEIGFTVSIVYICIQIKRQANISFNVILRRSLLITILVTIMAISVKLVESICSLFLSYEASRGQAILILIPSILTGMIVYIYLSAKSGLMEKMLGKSITSKMKRIVLRRG
jgi:O-antigen/teichoic acid export membrane protein